MADLNLDSKPLASAGGPPAQTNPTEAKDQIILAPTFFNVMPREKTQGGMVEAKMKIDSPPEENPQLTEIIKKYRWHIVIGVGALVLAWLIYFLIGKFAGGNANSDIKLNDLSQNTSPQNPETPKTVPVAPNFTTPQTWRDKYFPNCTNEKTCGDSADPDGDGLNNLQESKSGTDPNNPDSDQDGLADGDEVNIFISNPTTAHTSTNPKYTDADYAKGGYDITNDKKFTANQINDITAKMNSFSLHDPTFATLGSAVTTLYHYTGAIPAGTNQPPNSTSTLESFDQSLAAKQDRDTQRSNTINNVEVGLVKYQTDKKAYPVEASFSLMFEDIKPYLKVATNPKDPINIDPYVYSYTAKADGSDFTLTFYSEVAAAPISKHAADAVRQASQEQADIYDNQRQSDLVSLRAALLIYSQNNVAGNQTYVFPTKDKYKTALVPTYLSAIPKDPSTGQDYSYEPSATFDAFTLKATLQDPPPGNTGYICNQEEDCHYY